MKTVRRFGMGPGRFVVGTLAAVAVSLGLAGCPTVASPCVPGENGNCVNLNTSFQVESSTVSGDCMFSPYFVPSTITFTQPEAFDADGNSLGPGPEISTAITEPINNTPVTITGIVSAGDGSFVKASVSLTARYARQVSATDAKAINMQVTLAGDVEVDEVTRVTRFAGSLTTQSIGTDPCTVTISFSAPQS